MPTAPPETPPAAQVLQLATAGWVSAAVAAAAELGIADALSAGPRPLDDLAGAVSAHPPSLYRLLRACTDLGLFTETGDRVFGLTPLGDALRSDAPASMRGFAMWAGHAASRNTWTELAASIRTGRSAFAAVHGQGVWDHLRANPDAAAVFDRAMTDVSAALIPRVVASYDFTGFRRVVDVAGGHGALLAGVLRANPAARGVLHDQPEVIAGAGRPLKEAGVQDRCEFAPGSFFDEVPAGGDAYLLSNILHDWDDEESVRILANIRTAMAGDGRVLLIEAVMPAAGEPAPMVKLMDLDMLVLCDGRQRTEAEFAALLDRAGLTLSRVVPVRPGIHSVVEAVRR